MENTYINNNNKEDENKLKNLEARRRAARAFHERNNFMKEIKIMKYINKNKERTLREYIKKTKKEL